MERSVYRSTALGGLALLIASTIVLAEPQRMPTQAELADSALAAELGAVPEAVRRESLDRARSRILALADTKPDARNAAVIVFREGLTTARLSEFASSGPIEVIRAEAKVPAIDGSEDVTTISIGADDLVRLRGSLDSRLEASLARIRARFYIMSRNSTGADAGRLYDVAVSPEILFYKVQVIAPNSALSAVSKNPLAAAILVNENPEVVTSHERLKAAIVEQISNSPFGGSRPLLPGEVPTSGAPGSDASQRELRPAPYPEFRGRISPRPTK